MKRKAILIVVLAAFNLLAYGNGDPVARFSSIDRVRNPEPLSIPEIRIINETLKITHVDGYNCFDITYMFKNESGKDFPEIDYGFPIDYLVIDELESYQFHPSNYTESIYEVGWNEKLIKDISFSFNGSELPFYCAKESVKDISFETDLYSDNDNDSVKVEGINRRWFYTRFSMKPHEETTLNVRYKLYSNTSTDFIDSAKDFANYRRNDISDEYGGYSLSFLNRLFPARFNIIYDFTPAKHFGNGQPYTLELDIDLNNLNQPVVHLEGYWVEINRIMRSEYIKAAEIKPIDLSVFLRINSDDINAAIDKYSVSETKYRVTTNDSTISIDFHEPIFVSDLACDMDTTGVNLINSVVTYADGRQKQYAYQRYDAEYEAHKLDNIPILMTVTDIFDVAYKDTNDDLKIKSIRLTLDSLPTSSLKGVKVVDARFFK